MNLRSFIVSSLLFTALVNFGSANDAIFASFNFLQRFRIVTLLIFAAFDTWVCETFSAFTIDVSQLAIHAYFDSQSPAIIGDKDEYFLEIGGDEEDVYASFRWLERDSWFFNNWKADHGLDYEE